MYTDVKFYWFQRAFAAWSKKVWNPLMTCEDRDIHLYDIDIKPYAYRFRFHFLDPILSLVVANIPYRKKDFNWHRVHPIESIFTYENFY